MSFNFVFIVFIILKEAPVYTALLLISGMIVSIPFLLVKFWMSHLLFSTEYLL